MKISTILSLSLVVAICGACGPGKNADPDIFELRIEAEEIYVGDNVETALDAMLEFQRVLDERIAKNKLDPHLDPDPDQLRAGNYSRLYLIY